MSGLLTLCGSYKLIMVVWVVQSMLCRLIDWVDLSAECSINCCRSTSWCVGLLVGCSSRQRRLDFWRRLGCRRCSIREDCFVCVDFWVFSFFVGSVVSFRLRLIWYLTHAHHIVQLIWVCSVFLLYEWLVFSGQCKLFSWLCCSGVICCLGVCW